MNSLKQEVAVDLFELQKLTRSVALLAGELTPELLQGSNDVLLLRALKELMEGQASTMRRLMLNAGLQYMTERKSNNPVGLIQTH